MNFDPKAVPSLLPGRSAVPLDEQRVSSVVATFRGLQADVPPEDQCDSRHEISVNTHFRPEEGDDGVLYGMIIFGPDIFPGTGVLDPNSELSMKAAAAHELSHYHRWRDTTELPIGHLDEALTSLDAALRYNRQLSAFEVQQLIRDAMKRISLHQQDSGTGTEPVRQSAAPKGASQPPTEC
jgi:hypothetical protein